MNSEQTRGIGGWSGNPFVVRALAELDVGAVVGARGATARLSGGREVIDLASGGFGYGHPNVVQAVAAQVRAMPLSSRMFYSVPLAELARRLAGLLPGDLEVCFFGSGAAEAVEGALKLVKGYHRGRTQVVAAVGGFHGATSGALAVSGFERVRSMLSWRARSPVEAAFVPYGDVDAIRKAVTRATAAVILEPVLASFGARTPPPGYLQTVSDRCKAVGALLVIDEATSGLGRTGRRWGVDHDGVAPDIMVLGGALGGGVLPIGCYVATKRVNDRVYDRRDPLLHANTTGGNPSACRAALAALDVLEREDLAGQAHQRGESIRGALDQLCTRHADLIRSSCGRGLIWALSVRDAAAARAVQREALRRGVLVRVDGLATGDEVWIGVRPPLLVQPRELERGLGMLASAIDSVASSRTAAPEVRA